MLNSIFLSAQVTWRNVDSLYHPLPKSVHVYYTDAKIDTSPFRAYYVIADLKDKKLDFTADTTYKRRFTPAQFYEKNDKPLLVVNCTFFSFETNQNLNVVIKDGQMLSTNHRLVKGKGKDSVHFSMPHLSAFGISRKGNADIAWIKSDTVEWKAFASQKPPTNFVYFKTKEAQPKPGSKT
ncbi:MAG: hypothetical protein IPH18_02160 [Chitinophagaceae bacterium]|nr:hypothetical protein [Chitinophagaceae bacterium]